MSMFNITGKLMHTYVQPGRTDKDTGEVTEAKHKVQILGSLPVPNGDSRFDMVTLTCPNPADFQGMENKTIRVSIGAFAPSKNQIIWFIPKGSKPKVVGERPSTPTAGS